MAIEVLVPPLGQTVDTVTIVSWYREEGQAVTQGEMLYAIETDKATLDIEAPASGVLRHVTAAPGDEVSVLSAIALIAAPDEILAGTPAILEAEPVRRQAMDSLSSGQGAGNSRQQRRAERILISPRARRLAEEQGIHWAALAPSGPEGAIIERDVLAHLEARQTVDRVGLGVAQALPATGIRETIADRVSQSAGRTALVTLNVNVDATALVDVCHRLNQDGVDASYDDLLLYILGRALREHPCMNTSLEADTVRQWQQIHIGLAVDSDTGFLVPVVRNVDHRGLGELSAEARALIERASAGQSAPHELSGGTFTLANLGILGIDSFTPFLNPPECAVLGAGRIQTRPAVTKERFVARQMMWLSLTFDHRLVDRAPAARFLQRVVHLIEQPYLLLT